MAISVIMLCMIISGHETGLIYMNQRWYDPESAQFLSEDPARDGMNWYSYCGGNPVGMVDPMGLDSDEYNGTNYRNDDGTTNSDAWDNADESSSAWEGGYWGGSTGSDVNNPLGNDYKGIQYFDDGLSYRYLNGDRVIERTVTHFNRFDIDITDQVRALDTISPSEKEAEQEVEIAEKVNDIAKNPDDNIVDIPFSDGDTDSDVVGTNGRSDPAIVLLQLAGETTKASDLPGSIIQSTLEGIKNAKVPKAIKNSNGIIKNPHILRAFKNNKYFKSIIKFLDLPIVKNYVIPGAAVVRIMYDYYLWRHNKISDFEFYWNTAWNIAGLVPNPYVAAINIAVSLGTSFFGADTIGDLMGFGDYTFPPNNQTNTETTTGGE